VHQHVVFEGGNYFHNPTLLEFAAENPVRHGKLPRNILEVAKVILEAGVEQSALNETLLLVATGRVPRECDVQLGLIGFFVMVARTPTAPYGQQPCTANLKR
jgi:peptide-methionine (S)-S-oxide reductase